MICTWSEPEKLPAILGEVYGAVGRERSETKRSAMHWEYEQPESKRIWADAALAERGFPGAIEICAEATKGGSLWSERVLSGERCPDEGSEFEG